MTLVMCVLISALSAQQPLLFDADSLLARNRMLSDDAMEGRGIGTDGSTRAREMLIETMDRLGVQPLNGAWEHPFSVVMNMKKGIAKGTNVLGWIAGTEHPEEYIVVSCHYDHMGIMDGEVYNGADDNASGTAALLAFAEYFSTHAPRHSIIFAAFDGEETGLIGSRAFVDDCMERGLAIKANVNMDMIGRNEHNEIYLCGRSRYPDLYARLAIPEVGVTVKFGHDGSDGKEDWTMASDHANFHRRGIPFIYLGEEDHPDYHEPTDDFERLMPEFYQGVTQLAILLTIQLDEAFANRVGR